MQETISFLAYSFVVVSSGTTQTQPRLALQIMVRNEMRKLYVGYTLFRNFFERSFSLSLLFYVSFLLFSLPYRFSTEGWAGREGNYFDTVETDCVYRTQVFWFILYDRVI